MADFLSFPYERSNSQNNLNLNLLLSHAPIEIQWTKYLPCFKNWNHKVKITDYRRSMNFSSKSQTFGLGQKIWADKFRGIFSIFGQLISPHFGTVSPLSMFSINQSLFLQKLSLYNYPKSKCGGGAKVAKSINVEVGLL